MSELREPGTAEAGLCRNWMPFMLPNQQRQRTKGSKTEKHTYIRRKNNSQEKEGFRENNSDDK